MAASRGKQPVHQCAVLETLSADLRVRVLVAGNPAASVHLLEMLARKRDVQVRQTVASNPNTSWLPLEELAWEFPCEFLSNLVGPLQIIAYPECVPASDPFWGAVWQIAPLPRMVVELAQEPSW